MKHASPESIKLKKNLTISLVLYNLSLFLEDQWAARVTFPDMVEEVPLLVEAVVTVDALERLHI